MAEHAVAYTVEVAFTDRELATEWVAWLRNGHIADVIAGGASRAELIEVEGGLSFEVRYTFPSSEAFTKYEQAHAPRLRAEGLQRFPVDQGVTYQRTLGRLLLAMP